MRKIVKTIILNKKYIQSADTEILKRYLYISHLRIRRLIGILALVLAIGVPAVDYFINGNVGSSISSYYHTGARDVFVAILCIVGVFLVSYRSYNKWEKFVTFLLGILVVAIAFLPTTPENPSNIEKLIGHIHVGCAIAFFILFAILARLIFKKNTFGVMDEDTKRVIEQRNVVYDVCNIVLFLDGVICLIYLLLGYKDILVFESIALSIFGIAWIVKGKMIRHLISKFEYRKINF